MGKLLYESYAKCQKDFNNCMMDDWDDLDICDQTAWNGAAQRFLWKTREGV